MLVHMYIYFLTVLGECVFCACHVGVNGTLKAAVFACTVNSVSHGTEEHHHGAITLCCWKAFFFPPSHFCVVGVVLSHGILC